MRAALVLALALGAAAGHAACFVVRPPQAESPNRARASPRSTPTAWPSPTPVPTPAPLVRDLRPFAPLTPRELTMARAAWRYFENNFQAETGLVNAVQNFPSTTTWDTGSYIGALVAARELGLIDKNTFDRRLTQLLGTLNSIPLFRDVLPNKVYHTKTGQMVNYRNEPGELGWSAIDLGRLLIWLEIVKQLYPEHGNAADRAVLRWTFCNLVDQCGVLFGSAVGEKGELRYLQEGRLGYEEYAARGFELWGFDAGRAKRREPYNTLPLFGVQVPFDTRDPRETGGINYVVTESYVLGAVELGWDLDGTVSGELRTDNWMAEYAQRIYDVQEARYRCTGVLTARTEHQLDVSPYFVYDTIFAAGLPWATMTDQQRLVPQFAAVAAKAALGLWGVWDTPYTDLLFEATADLYDPDKGYYEGVYENGKGAIRNFTANNNGIILEILLYRTRGPILRQRQGVDLWRQSVGGPCDARHRQRCYPTFGPACGERKECGNDVTAADCD
jgi:hypothetical protein